MPGVNVPWSQVLYYLITLTVSGVFHEFGHAISAVRCVAHCSLACKQAPVSAEAQVKKPCAVWQGHTFHYFVLCILFIV